MTRWREEAAWAVADAVAVLLVLALVPLLPVAWIAGKAEGRTEGAWYNDSRV